jgi:acyl carrier protein
MPDADDLRAAIRRELRAIRPEKLPAEWPDDARFREDLGLDSLDLVEMVARLEQQTGLYVPDADLPQLASVAATAAYIEGRRAR